ENSFDSSKPVKLHDVQIDGFEKWSERRRLTADGGGKWITGKFLLELIRDRFANRPEYPGKYSVSATSLHPYYQCSLKWLFEQVLALENVEIEASLMAENITGIVYHNVLNAFFSLLKEKKEMLAEPVYTEQGPSLPEVYGKILEECIDKIFAEFPLLENGERPQMSSLTSRFLRAGKRQAFFHLKNCLVKFLALFAGCHVAGSETLYKTERGKYFLNGKLDCILEDTSSNDDDEEKKYIIVDFKLKYMPSRVECNGDGENGLANFQLPMYITLAEENEKIKVHTALFYSILNLEPQVIIGTVEDSQTKKTIPFRTNSRILHNSEKYNQILEEFNIKSEQFANEISTGNFSVFESKYNKCNECNYSRICRTVYVINREKNISLGKL
ncbi:MAG: PD-(D/E)XK nuclease family protein, partial [Treponema sp.]|nr:PD-(D/E)XK nuclease family protein [Treponema sp.]